MRIWKKNVASCLVLALLGAVCLGGCRAKDAENARIPQIKIGVSLYYQEDTFISLIRDALEKEAKAWETAKGVKITLRIVDGKNNQSIQNEQVERFIEQDCQVMCINEVDRTNASVIIDKARAADVPVIFFNREPVSQDIKRWEKVYYVGSDAVEAGKMQGKMAANRYWSDHTRVDRNRDGRLQYIMLEGEPGHQDAALRTEYAVKTIRSRGIRLEKLASDSANWQRAQAYTKMNVWLQDPELADRVEVVLCNNDDMALGVIDAYREYPDLPRPLIYGVDGTPLGLSALETGELDGTVYNDALGQAHAIFQLAYALATDTPVESLDIPLEGQYVWIPHQLRKAKDYP